MSQWGFTVQRYTKREHVNGNLIATPTKCWQVYLPHQCDDWMIVGDTDDNEAEIHANAVAILKSFISEAELALRELEAKRELR
jgi:hypothetical protein